MLDQLNKAPERANALPANLLQEISDSQKADLQAVKPVSHDAASAGQAKSVELSDPFKDANKDANKEAAKPGDQKKDQPALRYENDNLVDAFTASMKTGLPLVVQIGASWCPHCNNMEKNVWPSVEGTADKQGSLQGKAIFLHLDYDKSESLKGDAGALAARLREGVDGFPTFRMFNVAPDGKVSYKAQSVGEMDRAKLEKFLTSNGVK